MKKTIYPITASFEKGEVYNGFHMFYNGIDFFMISNARNITDSLTVAFANAVFQVVFGKTFDEKVPKMSSYRAETIKVFKYKIKRAKCEIRQLVNGRKYAEISGSNFGGYGSFLDDGSTYIFDQNGGVIE